MTARLYSKILFLCWAWQPGRCDAYLPQVPITAIPGARGPSSARLSAPRPAVPPQVPTRAWPSVGLGRNSLARQWRERVNADPRFASRFVWELLLAAILQLIAEAQRRRGAFGRELDYVVAGVLTACFGKGSASFRVAPSVKGEWEGEGEGESQSKRGDVPTNAFQRGGFLPSHRALALVAPVPRLFVLGSSSALAGYGLVAFLAFARDTIGCGPLDVTRPPAVPLLGAAVYTGIFVATVSNLSYQLLQGVLEPRLIDANLADWPRLRTVAIAAARVTRSFLASGLAIRGMQLAGLQKKS